MVGQQYFCYLYIEQEGQAFIAFGLTVIVVAFMIKTWRQFKLARQAGKINNTIKIIYIIILGLFSLYIPQIIVSETFFWLSKTYNPSDSNAGQIISKYIFFMQFLQQILFETILLLISYNWLNNLVNIFENVQKMFRKQIILLRFIKIFIWVRFADFALGVLFLLTDDVDYMNYYAKITLKVFISQQTLILISLLAFIILIKKNTKIKESVQKQSVNKMILTYAYLNVLIILNILWNIWYTIDVLTRSQQFINEQCGLKDKGWNAYDILQMAILIILNLLATIFVLRQYRVDQKIQKIQSTQNQHFIED